MITLVTKWVSMKERVHNEAFDIVRGFTSTF